MNSNLTEIVFLIDKSGSMHPNIRGTIRGFNDFIDEQKTKDGDARLTLVLFNDKVNVVYNGIYLPSVEHLSVENYYVQGMTALYDAIGITLDQVQERLNSVPEEFRAEKRIFVIVTDGMENSSMHFTKDNIAKSIAQKESEGWTFIYMGENPLSMQEAGSIGISKKMNISGQSISSGNVYRGVSDLVSTYRTTGSVPINWDTDSRYK